MPFDIDWFLVNTAVWLYTTLKGNMQSAPITATGSTNEYQIPFKWLTAAQDKLTAHTEFIIFIFNRSRFARQKSEPLASLGSVSTPAMTLIDLVDDGKPAHFVLFIPYIFIRTFRFIILCYMPLPQALNSHRCHLLANLIHELG